MNHPVGTKIELDHTLRIRRILVGTMVDTLHTRRILVDIIHTRLVEGHTRLSQIGTRARELCQIGEKIDIDRITKEIIMGDKDIMEDTLRIIEEIIMGDKGIIMEDTLRIIEEIIMGEIVMGDQVIMADTRRSTLIMALEESCRIGKKIDFEMT